MIYFVLSETKNLNSINQCGNDHASDSIHLGV